MKISSSIWNDDEHKREDVRTNAYYCFNHIIGLPQKDGKINLTKLVTCIDEKPELNNKSTFA